MRILGLLLIALFNHVASACEVMGGTAADWAGISDRVYVGRIVSLSAPEEYINSVEKSAIMEAHSARHADTVVTVKVYEVLKGDPLPVIKFKLGSCGIRGYEYMGEVVAFRMRNNGWEVKSGKEAISEARSAITVTKK